MEREREKRSQNKDLIEVSKLNALVTLSTASPSPYIRRVPAPLGSTGSKKGCGRDSGPACLHLARKVPDSLDRFGEAGAGVIISHHSR